MDPVVGKNLVVNQRKDGKVEIVFDPKVEIGTSSTGASKMIATTAGNLRIEELDLSIGLNVYRKIR